VIDIRHVADGFPPPLASTFIRLFRDVTALIRGHVTVRITRHRAPKCQGSKFPARVHITTASSSTDRPQLPRRQALIAAHLGSRFCARFGVLPVGPDVGEFFPGSS